MTDEICCHPISGFAARYFNSSLTAKAWAVVILLVATSGFAAATDQTPKSNPCNVSDADAAGLNHDLSTDVHAVREYINTFTRLVRAEKFEELDCLADHAREGKERFPGGMWKTHEMYKGLSAPVPYPQHAVGEDWQAVLQRLQRWGTARPNSITARVALADAYIGYAFDARGHGLSNTVTDSGWKLMAERTAQAESILNEASALPTKCPEWYIVMDNVALSESWDVARLRALFNDAFKFEPGYYYYGRAYALMMEPRWFGEAGDTERFLKEIADRIGGAQGDIYYFQVASSSDIVCGCDADPHLSGERIVRGYEASEKQYGISMLNLNQIAYVASQFRETDPVFAEKALNRIGDQWDEDSWKKKEEFDSAKKWAAQWAPMVAKRRASEAAAQANLQTPEGAHYKAAFEKTYRELLQDCARTDGSTVTEWKGKFAAMTSVSASGAPQDGWIDSMGPVVMCTYRKLRASVQEKTPLFPPPPQSPFWIKLDLDWADFAPVAAK